MNPLTQIWAIVKKDVVMELRTKEMVTAMLLFSVTSMVLFSVAFANLGKNLGAGIELDLTNVAGGLMWTSFSFMSLLGLNRSFVHEKDEGCLDGLLLAPMERWVIFFGKMLGNLIFIGVVEIISIPVFSLFFVKSAWLVRVGWMLAVLLLADIGICTLGTLFATISVNTKARDLLLPVLLLPVLIPLLIFTVRATGAVITGEDMGQMRTLLLSLAAYDAIFTLAAYGLYDFVIGE